MSTKTAGLLLAAGNGTRLGGHPKARLVLQGRSLAAHGVELLLPHVDEVIVAVGADDHDQLACEIGAAFPDFPVRVIVGGETRARTVHRLLGSTSAAWVLLHEVARPLTPGEVFAEVLAEARRHGAAVACQRHLARDSIGIAEGGELRACVSRSKLVILQTPHAYRRSAILAAHERGLAKAWEEEGTAPLALRCGIRLRLVECLGENLKITYPEDWERVRDGAPTP